MWLLKLTDGVEEVDMLSEFYKLEDGGLQIALPEAREVWGGNSIYANGSQLIISNYENRETTIMLSIYGETRDQLLANVSRIDRLILGARQRSMEEQGRRVELQYAWDKTSQTTFYEVVTGRLEWPENVMSVEGVHQMEDGKYLLQGFTLTLNTLPFAYTISPAEGEPPLVPLTNIHGTGTTVTVYNHKDAAHDSLSAHVNYVEINGSYLPGSFPMPIKLQLRGLGAFEKACKVYIGVRKGDQNFVSVLEDSAATERYQNVTPTQDTDTSSGGTYTSLSFASEEPVKLAKWMISDVDDVQTGVSPAEATQGAFRIFGRTSGNFYWSKDANYCLKVVDANGVLLHQTEWRTPLDTTTSLFDFGTVFLPPWLGSLTGIATFGIEIWAYCKKPKATEEDPNPALPLVQIKLDYLTLLPQDGGYRVLEFRGDKTMNVRAGVAEGELLVDDGWGRTVYHETQSGKRSGTPYGLMPAIALQPGVTHRLYFLVEGASGTTDIRRTMQVSVGIVPTYMVLA